MENQKPTKSETKRSILNGHLAGKSVLAAYRLCRRAGLAPWCSLRFALLRA
jgi:hypothetical protein